MSELKTDGEPGLEKRYVSMRKQRKTKSKIQPPLTPMIDVTFLLLIYFLLTATFREAEGQIPGSLPQTTGVASGEVVDLEPFRVTLVPAGVNNESCVYQMEGFGTIQDPNDLHGKLSLRKEQLSSPLIIAVRPRVRWQYVVEAFNQAVRAQYENIGFMIDR